MATCQQIAAILGAIFFIFRVAMSDPDTTLLSSICNGAKYMRFSEYDDHVNQVTECLWDFPANLDFDRYCRSNADDDVCYGHATCNEALSLPDCSECLEAGAETIGEDCAYSIGLQFNSV